MYQTVGHEGISLYAEAMGLPLYRAYTLGKAVDKSMAYAPTEGDEVEDLYYLLKRVQVLMLRMLMSDNHYCSVVQYFI